MRARGLIAGAGLLLATACGTQAALAAFVAGSG